MFDQFTGGCWQVRAHGVNVGITVMDRSRWSKVDPAIDDGSVCGWWLSPDDDRRAGVLERHRLLDVSFDSRREAMSVLQLAWRIDEGAGWLRPPARAVRDRDGWKLQLPAWVGGPPRVQARDSTGHGRYWIMAGTAEWGPYRTLPQACQAAAELAGRWTVSTGR